MRRSTTSSRSSRRTGERSRTSSPLSVVGDGRAQSTRGVEENGLGCEPPTQHDLVAVVSLLQRYTSFFINIIEDARRRRGRERVPPPRQQRLEQRLRRLGRKRPQRRQGLDIGRGGPRGLVPCPGAPEGQGAGRGQC